MGRVGASPQRSPRRRGACRVPRWSQDKGAERHLVRSCGDPWVLGRDMAVRVRGCWGVRGVRALMAALPPRIWDNSLPYFHKRPQVRMLLLALFCVAVSVVWGVFRNEDQ